MTRAELVDRVYQRHGGVSRREAHDLVDIILGVISERLARGESVAMAGFGTFEVTVAPSREGRHPVTGRPRRIPGRRQLLFRPSRAFRDRLNASGAGGHS